MKCVLVKPCGIVYTGLFPIEVGIDKVVAVVVVGHREFVVGGCWRICYRYETTKLIKFIRKVLDI